VGGAKSRPLAWQQFQELNFTFYEERPSEFINMRIEVLSLMLCSGAQLAPAYADERLIKNVRLGGSTPPDHEKRQRYIQTEAVVILHHAAETLLRLFYAHVDHRDCPWLGMAALTSFADFKAKINRSLEIGFDRVQLAETFLGGTSPTDACIALSAVDFEDAVDGLDLLMRESAERLLSESFLYNAIKHGLSTVALADDTQIAITPDGGDRIVGHTGPLFAYMHKPPWPGAKNGPQWFMSMTAVKTERDLALAVLIARAVESLWDVGRRRLTGKGGSICQVKKSVVELAIYALQMETLNVVHTITMEMPKLNDDGSLGDTVIGQRPVFVPDDYEVAPGVHPTDCPRINLPVRQRDQRVFSTSNRKIYPFSPNGSQQI
jgi:hypothetical protein